LLFKAIIQQNFQHILQFEDQFEPENPLDQLIQKQRRGGPQGSKNLSLSWKNTIASEWKPPKTLIPTSDLDSVSSRTRSKHHVNQFFVNSLDNELGSHKPSTNINSWTTVDYRKPKTKGTSIFFHGMGEYATDIKFHHIHIPSP
jgi:hypothetical protein